MTVRGDSLKVECWRKYTWDPDCLGCWVFYCPKHLVFERGTGEAMIAALREHMRAAHPRAQPVLH